MASALSVDLRERIVAAIEAGASQREAARRFEVSPASAVRWHGSFVQDGRTQAELMGGDQRSHTVKAQADLIQQTYEAQPELFLHHNLQINLIVCRTLLLGKPSKITQTF